MHHIDVAEVESDPAGSGTGAVRGLTEPLGTGDMAMNHYTLEPGDELSGGLHTHLDQEEVFYVVEGTATFETKDEATAETETVEVGPDEAVRFARGEFQQGRNETDERVVALALGAPDESTDVRVPEACRECDSDVLSVVVTDEGMLLKCPDCGATVEM